MTTAQFPPYILLIIDLLCPVPNHGTVRHFALTAEGVVGRLLCEREREIRAKNTAFTSLYAYSAPALIQHQADPAPS